jgi:hypothetical protein
MAQLNVIVISEVHGGVINRVKAFSNDEEGEAQSKAFVMELLEECVDEDDHPDCLFSIEEQGGFSFCELDVCKDYTH